jgi:RND family efflux transporter MFP subunit
MVRLTIGRLGLLATLAIGCGRGEREAKPAGPAQVAGQPLAIRDTVVATTFDAVGVAEPILQATLSTKLIGSVTAVLVREGERVARGAVLARVDARDVEAKRAQVDAGITAAEAVYQDALTQAQRFRALYADSAATRYQLDQVETGLTRAESGLHTARAARAELDAVGAYAEIRAPFAGTVTKRFVDPGAFASPGAPVAEVQDASRLRISVSVPAEVAVSLKRGDRVDAEVEGSPASATIEGAVPSGAGGVYTVNAIVANAHGEFPPGGSATLKVPQGSRRAILVPAAALVREGDLTGVRVKTPQGSDLRWVRLGAARDAGAEASIEVLSGLVAGDTILLGAR